MKSNFYLLIVFVLLGFSGNSQVLQKNNLLQEETNQIEKCAFDGKHRLLMQNDPSYFQKNQEFEEMVMNFVPSKTAATYKIPVVVHVMSEGTALTTISDQQIKDAIKGLNERLRKLAGGLGDGNGVDVEVEYALAVRDESGNCTNGIVRYDLSGNATYVSGGVETAVANPGITDGLLKSLSVWDQTKYYNMWLVSEIDGNNGGSGIQGYAYFASSHGNAEDGAVMLVNTFKNPDGTTLIHELGHSLNLYHTFEGDGTGASCPTNATCATQGDRCCDTPAHRRSSSDCVTEDNVCTGVVNATESDAYIHNYMDYSSDACQNMFTANQKTRMLAAISGTRASFLESNGNMSLVPVAAPVADFTSNKTILCGTGQTVKFYDLSTCSPNTFMAETAWTGITYSWTFTNGTTTYTSSNQNPSITFAVTGVFNAYLTITTAQGSDTEVKTAYIVVNSSPTAACTPTSLNPSANYGFTVSKVSFDEISNSTSTGTNGEYSDYSCAKTAVVTVGQIVPISLDLNENGGGYRSEVYIDYNNDGDFADAGESVFSGFIASGSGQGTVTNNVTIPAISVNVLANTLLRMRVYTDVGTSTAFTNARKTCSGNFQVADAEDYSVYISSCTNPTITGNTPSSRSGSGTVTLGATASAGTLFWYAASSGGVPLGSGTSFTTPSISSTTTYYVEAQSGSCVSAGRTAVVATVNTVNETKIQTSQCGVTLAGYNDRVWADAVVGATNYRFSITDGVTPQIFINSDPWFYFTWLPSGFKHNTTYSIQVASELGGIYGAYTATCNVTTPLPTSQVQPSQWNSTLTSINTGITSVSILNASGYKFEITEGSNTTVYTSTSRTFTIPASGAAIKYNTNYSIRVAVQVNGSTYGAWGIARIVTTPVAPSTQISATQCGNTLSAINTSIAANSVPYVSGYKFEITEGANTQTYTTANRSFTLTAAGLTYKYGTAYTIRVATLVNGSYGVYGASCIISTPSAPLTQIQASQCNVNLTPITVGDVIVANNVLTATNYRFKFVEGANTYFVTNPYRWFLMSQFAYALNKTYDVSVSVEINGVYQPYGSICQVTSPASAIAKNESDYAIVDGSFLLEAYPNPNTGDFSISSTTEGSFNIVNELGQLMYTVEITKENNFITKVEGLEKGVYFLTGTFDGNVVTKKILVL